jgi:hypothetical protein
MLNCIMVLIKHSAKEMYEGVFVRLHVFLNWELDGDKSAWWPSALPLEEKY